MGVKMNNPIEEILNRVEAQRQDYIKESIQKYNVILAQLRSCWFTEEFIDAFQFKPTCVSIPDYKSRVIESVLEFNTIQGYPPIYFSFSITQGTNDLYGHKKLEIEVFTINPKHSHCFDMYAVDFNTYQLQRERRFIEGIATFLVTHPNCWPINAIDNYLGEKTNYVRR